METLKRLPIAGIVLIGILQSTGAAYADPTTTETSTPASADMGTALNETALTDTRGGTEVINDMTLNGVVANNEAYNLSTGHNTMTDGAMSGASGMPTLIQNSGNNVLIQNATIVNVQLK